MAGAKKNWYQIETFDDEGPVGTYAAILTDLQAAEIKALLDGAVARKVFPHYRLAPYPQKQAYVHALTFASAKSSVKDDMKIAERSRKRAAGELGDSGPGLGAAVAVSDLFDVMGEIRDRHPGVRLREYDARGPRALWRIDDLVETVRRDMAAMTSAERGRYDVHRYSWGYDADGRVQVVHWPVRGGSATQFLQE